VASDHAMSPGSASGSASRCSRSRAACAASPVAPRADSSHAVPPAGGPFPSREPPVSYRGASSMITCAFVPLTPNADTPARRGRSPGTQATGWSSSRTAPAVQSTSGVGSPACRVAGSSPCRRASTILITPATPAAAWVCPMFDFTAPSSSGVSRSRP
jgi:hypothetical protein